MSGLGFDRTGRLSCFFRSVLHICNSCRGRRCRLVLVHSDDRMPRLWGLQGKTQTSYFAQSEIYSAPRRAPLPRQLHGTRWN